VSITGWTAASAIRQTRAARRIDARLSLAAARLPAFALLAGFVAHTWARMVQPAAYGAMAAALCAGVAGAAVLVAVARRSAGAPARAAATSLVAALLLVVAFAAAGVSADLAGPRAWDELADGIGQGLSAVPTVRVPYHGAEEWTRVVIVLGGGLLVGLGALLAFVPRRGGKLGYPAAAALVLGALYLVPVMQHEGEHPFAGGAAFALLVALFLWLERIERAAAPLAAGVLAVAVLVAVAVAPRVDGGVPLVDYEGLAQSLTTPSTRYDWNHGYGPLHWPRDGGELLRVKARDRSYWKATNLPIFDGRRWIAIRNAASTPRLDVGLEAAHPRWRQELQVTFRGLRSEQFVTAGTTIAIAEASRKPIQSEPGAYTTLDRPLRPGNGYRALVYTPRPTAGQLRAAARSRLPFDEPLSALTLPARREPVHPPVHVVIPPWGVSEPAPETVAAIEASPYARAFELARRLRARSATPYDFVLAVERHLHRGYRYSESPRASAFPLMEFLFGEKRGYCQQFSGAMALLLRLGGVPARVAAGFAPGAFDPQRREYVVRDLDAHSWVEVFFPRIGWVTRDPTPSAAPARSQVADISRRPTLDGAPRPPEVATAPLPRFDRGTAGSAAPAVDGGGSALPVIALAVGAVLVALAALRALLAIRRDLRAAAGDAGGPLGELQRALRRSGLTPPAQMTLEALAGRWRDTAAEGYVRAVAAARYGYHDAVPTPAQRAGLRRELAAGRGLRRRLRAWWALPPRTPRAQLAAGRRRGHGVR
jgi:transglutaminase-like putative cysteine protease